MKVTKEHIDKHLIVNIYNLVPREIKVLAISHNEKYVRFQYAYSGNFDLIKIEDINVLDTIEPQKEEL